MAKGSGSGGRGGYGSGVRVVENKRPFPEGGSFVSATDASKRIAVSPATEGSEKQISWANSIKQQAMVTVDETAANLIRRGANAARTTKLRNKVLAAINRESNAKSIIDNLRNRSNSLEALARYYNITP